MAVDRDLERVLAIPEFLEGGLKNGSADMLSMSTYPRNVGHLSRLLQACMIVSSIQPQCKRGTHITPLDTTHNMVCKGSTLMNHAQKK